MLHLTKLAVGVTDLAHLAALQAARRASGGGVLRHLTRNFPRRAAEVAGAGSMYWVIAGSLCVRQPIADIVEAAYDDGSRCAAILLEPALVPVQPRRTKPFQGWRYLTAEAAPPDLAGIAAADGIDQLPPALLQELRSLGLL